MRLNKYIALHTEFSRRKADELVDKGRVLVNGKPPQMGQPIVDGDRVAIDGHEISQGGEVKLTTLIMNKPAGYVCSRRGQGSWTIYELIPPELRHLNSIGRLDKDSSGLLLMTNDGELANRLTHPKYQKRKVYEVVLNKSLQPLHQQMISDYGVTLEDGVSKLMIQKLENDRTLEITMHEGRNRQIRRTFESLGYEVLKLHRSQFGDYHIGELLPTEYEILND